MLVLINAVTRYNKFWYFVQLTTMDLEFSKCIPQILTLLCTCLVITESQKRETRVTLYSCICHSVKFCLFRGIVH